MVNSLQGLGGREQGTQQENTYTKHAVTNRLPVTVKLGRVTDLHILLTTCFVKDFLRRCQMLRTKTNSLGFKITGWLQYAIHDVHIYIIG